MRSTGAQPWALKWYILWRAVGAVLIALLVLTTLFVALEVLPGDPTRFVTPRWCGGGGPILNPPCGGRQTLIDQWGLDKPLLDRYFIFLGNVLTGNLGVSITINPGTPVWTIIEPTLAPTLAVFGITLVLASLAALALGIPLSRRRGSRVDGIISFLLAIPFALTAPVLAFLSVYLLVIVFPVVPLPGASRLDLAPAAVGVVVAFAGIAGLFTWSVRDYPLRRPTPPPSAAGDWRLDPDRDERSARAAIARLLAALPAIVAWSLTALVAEAVWNINGLGLLLWSAVQRLDFFVIMGVIVVVGLLVVLPIVTAADILHAWLTNGWVRSDGRTVDDFEVRASDLGHSIRTVLTRASGLVGVVLILGLAAAAALAPVLVGPYPGGLNLARPNLPPSSQYLLGTDNVGQDVLTLLVYGAIPAVRVSLFALAVALAASLAAVAALGLLDSRADVFLRILVDAGLVLPLPGVALFAYAWPGAWGVLLPGLIAWPLTTRILLQEVEGLVPPQAGPGRVGAVRRGRRAIDVIWGTGPLIVGNAMLAVALALAISTILDFSGLGFGFIGPGGVASWGTMILQAYFSLEMLKGAWWTFVPPAVCVLGAVLGPTLVGLTVKRLPLGGGRGAPVAVPAHGASPSVEVAPPQ